MQIVQMRSRRISTAVLSGAILLATAAGFPAYASGGPQAASGQAAAPGSRVTGTVTAIAGNVLTVKDDKGTESKVTVPDSSRVLQVPAGSKSLSAATPIKVQDIAVGDRILAKATPEGDGYTASTLVAMKQSDVAQQQQQDRQAWQTKGIHGLVKAVDPAAGTITVSTGSGATAKTVVVKASKATNIRRYAPNSTKFDDAKPSSLEEIKAGDQLRAKGEKNADGTELAADAILAGTFRNIAGTVISVDPAANAVTVTDLATKKPVVIAINSDSQLHKLSPTMAQGIAARLGGGNGGAGANKTADGASAANGAPAPGGGGSSHGAGGGSQASAGAPPSGEGAPGQRSGDLQQMLNRAPTLSLGELKKGDAIMVLTTEGQTPGAATAITLLAGVEPLLQAAPGSSQSVLSASWSVGGSAPAGGDAQ